MKGNRGIPDGLGERHSMGVRTSYCIAVPRIKPDVNVAKNEPSVVAYVGGAMTWDLLCGRAFWQSQTAWVQIPLSQ